MTPTEVLKIEEDLAYRTPHGNKPLGHIALTREMAEALVSPRYRHLKRGTLYSVVTDSAKLQCSTSPHIETLFAEDLFTVYRSIETGEHYIRLTPEFEDGRFEKVEQPQGE
jgi:hypothetical protein